MLAPHLPTAQCAARGVQSVGIAPGWGHDLQDHDTQVGSQLTWSRYQGGVMAHRITALGGVMTYKVKVLGWGHDPQDHSIWAGSQATGSWHLVG